MKTQNQNVKTKNKSVSRTLIALSCVFFIASAILVVLGLYENKLPATVDGNLQAGTVEFTDEAQINPALNESIVSVILDAYYIRSIDSLKAQTCVINTSDTYSILESYTKYLDTLAVEGISYELLYGDYDGDGNDEYYLYVYIPVQASFTAFGSTAEYNAYISSSGSPEDSHGVIIYGDSANGQTVLRTYYSSKNKLTVHNNITVNNGVLSVKHDGNNDEIYVVCTPYIVYSDYAYQAEAFRQMCDSYASSLVAKGYTDVYYYCADLSDAPGEETAFVYTDKDGYPYTVIVTFINGKIHYIYNNFSEVCATYITEINSVKYLVEYIQIIGSDNYENNYTYRVYRFDENYNVVNYESESTTVNYGTVSSENESFFSKFNSYISIAIVLADPYELTGYSSLAQSSGMSTHKENEQSSPDSDSAYLYISNCSTSKQGIVNVPETSYLNFREGPSVSYPKILIDRSDSDSYVRQLRGSSVTVMDTVNTGDEENPVWLRIQIKYNDLTLTGYSSQMWIDLPGIRYVSVGDRFTVTADTNESELYWSCNDTSVATVDSVTGELTAHRPGVVMVTVTSESGLSDSCLIAIQ